MSTQIELRCRCGAVRGTVDDVDRTTVNHGTCYCTDCRAFALFLNRPDILNAKGGTDIVQTAPRRVRFTQGQDQLRCMRLSEKGLLRWYSACCNTPMGNMLSPRIPFVGLPRTSLEDGIARSGHTADELLGKPDPIYAREASGGPLPGAHPTAPPRVALRAIALMLGWWIRGLGKPSPYFDPATGEPRVTPKVLSVAEREQLRALG